MIFCSDSAKRQSARGAVQEEVLEPIDPYIFYHEFLYLLCNTQDRIEAIVKNHKMDLKSKKGIIYQWEISKGFANGGKAKTSHIDLLADNAFKNEAPQHLIEEALRRFASEHRFKFEGASKEKSKRVTSESLDQMFEKRYDHLIKQREKIGKDFQYDQPDDVFGGDILTFSSQNYDKSKYDIETLKQRQKMAKRGGLQDFVDMAQDDFATNNGNTSGLYKTQKTVRVNGFNGSNYKEYNPKEFQVEPGVYDFRKAPGYDEDIVRYNLNKVKRPKTAKILAPTLVKEVEVKEAPNFIKMNKNGLNEISRLNV